MNTRRRETERRARLAHQGEHTPRSTELGSSIAELYELEQHAYRLVIREAKRIGRGPPAVALRAVAGHANETLEELPRLASQRGVRLGSTRALLLDAVDRVRDLLRSPMVDREYAYRQALTALRRGLDLARSATVAAIGAGDEALATWFERWLRGREELVDDAADELEWFTRHPQRSPSRLPGSAVSV